MSWIDISQPLFSQTAVWPGDTPFTFSLNWSKEETGSVNVGKIEMSTHTGTHIDAPFHFDDTGKRVLELDLERYMGKAIVIDVTNKASITVRDFENVSFKDCKIILLKTNSWTNRTVFPTQITCIHPEVAHYLSEKNVKLLGVDVPSVDPLDSKELTAHHELTFHDIHILEGLVLDDVLEGVYDLIALPLPIKDSDASPVRAVIRAI